MPEILLQSKFRIPQIRRAMVERERLINRLNDGVKSGCRLTLVSAPAGFGKTTLIADWLNRLNRPRAWLSLDEDDNNPIRFLRYFIAALQQVDQYIGEDILLSLQYPYLAPMQSMITLLMNDIAIGRESEFGNPCPGKVEDKAALCREFMIVLDDYQVINHVAIHEAIELMVENQPTQMHLIIITRRDPPLPLSQWRVRSELNEIRLNELRFTTEEAATFLNQRMGLNLMDTQIASLEAKTEGWIAGLQLVALSLRDCSNSDEFIINFTGSQRHIIDYLASEVIQWLDKEIFNFLLHTSIVENLNSSLCNALTGRVDSQSILEQLEKTNLFIIPLDQKREWYRYHTIFAEVLRSFVDQQQQKELHQKAAHWYKVKGFVNEAIKHTLAAGDLDSAETLISDAITKTVANSGLRTVSLWLEAFPEERIRASRELCAEKGWILALTGNVDQSETYAYPMDSDLSLSKHSPRANSRILGLRAFIALRRQDYAKAIENASKALELMGEDDILERTHIVGIMAIAQAHVNDITVAIQTYRDGAKKGQALGNQLSALLEQTTLARFLNIHGKLREAQAVCKEAIDQVTDSTGQPSLVIRLVFSMLGVLYHESNLLDEARQYLEKGLALSEKYGFTSNVIMARLMIAPTLYAQGEIDRALVTLQETYWYAFQLGYTLEADQILAAEVDMRLKQGDLAFAIHWAREKELKPDITLEFSHMPIYLTYTRVLIAQGKFEEALYLLTRLEYFTQERALYRWLISVHILQASTEHQLTKNTEAFQRLAKALNLASPEEYIRAFLDEDENVVVLLKEMRTQSNDPTICHFVDKLLYETAAGNNVRWETDVSRVHLESLSKRELEILSLLAKNLTYAQIANHLFVSLSTVQSHVKSAYRKLDVHSRVEAVLHARKISLL